MKKYFALIISILVILTCFTACKPKIKNGTVVQNGVGADIAVVTNPDGGLVRDSAGNLIVLVTDENGRNVKDENGEYKTNAIAMQHAIVIGRRVEAPNYSVIIPDGWSNVLSLNDLSIKRDGTTDESLIITEKDGSVSQAMQPLSVIFNNIAKSYPNVVSENTTVKINDSITANFMSAFVPEQKIDENGNIVSTYLGYFFFEEAGHTYTCKIEARRDLGKDLDEYIKILSSIQFH